MGPRRAKSDQTALEELLRQVGLRYLRYRQFRQNQNGGVRGRTSGAIRGGQVGRSATTYLRKQIGLDFKFIGR